MFGRQAILAALVVLPHAALADDWVMGFHDSRHTGQTSEVVTPPLTVAWTWKDTYAYDNGNGGKFNPQPRFWLPVFYRGKISFQGGLNANRLFCLNPADGSKVWEADNPGYTASGTYLFQFDNYPAAVNGRIVNASTDFTASTDAATGGDSHTTYNTNGGWPSGGVASWNGLAYIQYVRTDDGAEGFNIVQDATNWTLSGGYTVPDRKTTFTDYGFRVPAVDAYATYTNFLGVLTAGDALTGRTLWTWGKTNLGSSPAVSNGTVYFYSAAQHQMVALDAAHVNYSATPAQVPTLWSIPMAGAFSPIVSDGTLYVGAADGYFYALDAATGAKKWSFRTGAAFTPLQIPAVSGELVYVPGANGTLYVLQKNTGLKIWSYTGSAAWGPVAIAGGMVFASQQSTLYAFRPQTAAIGPSVTGLSIGMAANGQAVFVNLTGSGFFAGGAAGAVESVFLDNHLDNPGGTVLTGYTVTSDQSINGVVIPAGTAPGTYHIKVRTSAGQTANEPPLEIAAAGSSFVSTLGQSTGPYYAGTTASFQRHLVRTRDGTLAAVYIGPAGDGGSQYSTYNFSRDGGLTWTAQSQLPATNNATVIWAAASSVFVDAQDHIDVSYIQWPSYAQTFKKFATGANGILTADAGFPIAPAPDKPEYAGALVSEPGGRLWLAYQSGGNVTALYSDDAGQTWTRTPQVNKASANSPAMVLSQGKPAVIYAEGGRLTWSAWNGQQWSAPEVLPGPIGGVQQNLSAVATAGNGIQVAYATANGGVNVVGYSGSAWSAPQSLDAAGIAPSLTTDGTNLWCFYSNSAGDLVYRRTNNGQWNSAVAITSDGNHNTSAATLELSPDPLIPVIWTSGPSTGYTVKSAVVPKDLSPQPVSGGVSVWVGPPAVTLSAGQTQQFTAAVSNAGATAVTWKLNPNTGTIDSQGLYTAPASIDTRQTVVLTATSAADSGQSAAATITLVPPPPVTVTPATATLSGGGVQQFTADTPVTWSLNPAVGAISSEGLYTAPRVVTGQRAVTVIATSKADASKGGSASVMLVKGRPAPLGRR